MRNVYQAEWNKQCKSRNNGSEHWPPMLTKSLIKITQMQEFQSGAIECYVQPEWPGWAVWAGRGLRV